MLSLLTIGENTDKIKMLAAFCLIHFLEKTEVKPKARCVEILLLRDT